MVGLIDQGKRNLLGVLVNVIDYEAATERIIIAARSRSPLSASATAVHGVMTGVDDREHRYRLNHLDLVSADGQPVRWALNLLYGAGLSDRVYGPTLMLRLCERAALEGLPIFLYGSTSRVLESLATRLKDRYPTLVVAGTEESKFRRTTADEKRNITLRIAQSGARLVFVGLGCPRQEVFAFEYRSDLQQPIIAVGAAFDYHAGLMKEPPALIQRCGLQWLYRLLQDPRRLWRRYLILNTRFVLLFVLQWRRLKEYDPLDNEPPHADVLYG